MAIATSAFFGNAVEGSSSSGFGGGVATGDDVPRVAMVDTSFFDNHVRFFDNHVSGRGGALDLTSGSDVDRRRVSVTGNRPGGRRQGTRRRSGDHLRPHVRRQRRPAACTADGASQLQLGGTDALLSSVALDHVTVGRPRGLNPEAVAEQAARQQARPTLFVLHSTAVTVQDSIVDATSLACDPGDGITSLGGNVSADASCGFEQPPTSSPIRGSDRSPTSRPGPHRDRVWAGACRSPSPPRPRPTHRRWTPPWRARPSTSGGCPDHRV